MLHLVSAILTQSAIIIAAFGIVVSASRHIFNKVPVAVGTKSPKETILVWEYLGICPTAARWMLLGLSLLVFVYHLIVALLILVAEDANSKIVEFIVPSLQTSWSINLPKIQSIANWMGFITIILAAWCVFSVLASYQSRGERPPSSKRA